MKQLEMFEHEAWELDLLQEIVDYPTVTKAAEALDYDSRIFYAWGRKLCPHHKPGELWKPYFKEYLRSLCL